ncbi:MAG: hypothetical protein ABI685_08550, partial [Ferruginibacter sp.]
MKKTLMLAICLGAFAMAQAQKAKLSLTSPVRGVFKTVRPTFDWKLEPANATATYSIVVREWEKGKSFEAGKIIFEKRGLDGKNYVYPADAPALSPAKKYGARVSTSFMQNGKS